MSKPFAVTITYSYLCELEVMADVAMTLAEKEVQVVNNFLNIASGYLRDRLAATDTNDHTKDAKYRRDMYNNICTSFFAYGYTRYWVFKPACMSPFADSINNEIFEGSPSFSEHIALVFPKYVSRFDKEFLAHLDLQIMQWLYTYCFENGINFRFY